MKNKIKQIINITSAVIIQFFILFCIIMYQSNVIMYYSLPIRAVTVILLQWLLLIVPFYYMKAGKESFNDIGFSSVNIPRQITVGIAIAAAMAFLFAAVPIMLGYKHLVGSTEYSQAWQFLYQLFYMIFGVALAEEIFFRGFLYKRILDCAGNKWHATVISSVIFGLSHIFSGNMHQVVVTVCIGIIFCLCRDKIKHCTTLSLIIAHGFYNALITLLVAVL